MFLKEMRKVEYMLVGLDTCNGPMRQDSRGRLPWQYSRDKASGTGESRQISLNRSI